MSEIPFYVWPVFVVLLVGGLKARKTTSMPLTALVLIPLAFFIWSFFSLYQTYDTIALSIWILSLSAGVFIGYKHMQGYELRFFKKQVELPGSWIPLILSMSIFTSKFSLGVMGSLFPDLTITLICLELTSALILGVFLGRAFCCLARYRSL
jgi:hypothetical protein